MRDDVRGTKGLAVRAAGCGAGVLAGSAVILGLIALWLSSCEVPILDFEAKRNDGTRSQRLPVQVEPAVDLADGTVVTVSSDAFDPNEVVGVAVCLEVADTESAGVDACDEVSGARFAVSPDGRLAATYPVPRVITVAGVAHDCAAPGTSCLLVAADANDYDRSGGQRITFRPDLGAVDLVPTMARPHSLLLPVLPPSFQDLTAGSTVEVTASGFQPGEPVVLAHCAGFPDRSAMAACAPVDDQAVSALITRETGSVGRHADGTGTAVFAFTALPTVSPFQAPTEQTSCAAPSSVCSFVIAAAADTQRSAVVPYRTTP